MHGLPTLLWLQKQNRLYNGWLTDSPIEYYMDGTRDELEEVRKSYREADHDELELEVGDLLWDVLSLINKLDHEKLIDLDRVCPRAIAKYTERMPYLIEERFVGSYDERTQMWDDAKKLQKSRGVDEQHPLVQQAWQSAEQNN